MFHDRSEAGRRLANELSARRFRQPIVLALPRGGLPVAFEIARALDAPLDVLVVRKVGAPLQPELGVGALVGGDAPETLLDRDLLERLGLREEDLTDTIQEEALEVRRREALYRAGRAPTDVAGRTVILVDDGIATGSSVRAALHSLRRRRARSIVLAVPVAPAETLESLLDDADEIVCLETPAPFGAVGRFYEDFRQVSDDEVVDLLARSRRFGTADHLVPAHPGPAG